MDDEDHKQSTRRQPMGVVTLGPRRFVVSMLGGWEFEWLELVELSGPRFPVVLKVPGGGC